VRRGSSRSLLDQLRSIALGDGRSFGTTFIVLTTLLLVLLTPLEQPTLSLAQAHIQNGSADPSLGASGSRLKSTFDGSTVLVRISNAARNRTSQILDAHGLSGAAPIGETGFVAVSTQGQPAGEVVKRLRQDPAVTSVQLDYERQASRTPNDPYYGLTNPISQRPYMNLIRMGKAWNISRGSKHYKIAVLDTGVAPIEDLSGRLLPGYNFISRNSDTHDINGHGTVVAGIAAAATNNGRDIAGVAWHARIIPVLVLNSQGIGTDTNIARGITWATDHGANVINMSLGGPAKSPVLRAAIAYAHRKGVVLVAAAGNEGSAVRQYPAAYRPVVAVTAVGGDVTNETMGQFAWFSNYGSWVDIAAPGTEILGTTPVGVQAIPAGTSLAAPFVAGAVVLMESHHPGWSSGRIVRYLESRAKDMGPPGIDPYYGHGLLDTYAALGGPKQPQESFLPEYLVGEPADTPQRAIPIASSGSGLIYPEGDVDWFSTEASSGTLSFTVTPPRFRSSITSGDAVRTGEMVANISVYGPDLNLLGHRYGMVLNNLSTITVPVTKSGPYYIRVSNLLGSRGPISDGPYSVTVARSSAETPPVFDYAKSYRSPGTTSTVLADVTGDHHPELLVATIYGLHGGLTPHVLVFANGSRTRSSNLLGRFAPNHYLALAAGDLNGDGRRDVAVTNGSEIRIFYRTAHGLSAPASVPIPDVGAEGDSTVGIDDMNNDGRNDLIIEAPGTNIYVLIQSAHGFSPQLVGEGQSFKTADVTGDGRTDIVSFLNPDSTRDFASIVVFVQQPDGTFVKSELPVGSAPSLRLSDIGVGDLTGDGRIDVAASAQINSTDSGALLVFGQNQNGSLSSPESYPVDRNIGGMDVKDVNGDGRPDVVATDTEAADVLLQRSDGTLGGAVDYISALQLAQPNGEPLVRDLNGDGLADILTPVTTGLEVLTAPSGSALARDTNPVELATGVSRRVAPSMLVVPSFSRSSISGGTVRLIDADRGRDVHGTRSYDPSTGKLTFHPASILSPSTPYVFLVHGLRDARGKRLQDRMTVRFTTGP
jgi:subtilisin family serine protease